MKLPISARLVLLVVLLVTVTATTISFYLYRSGITILAEHALNDLSHNLQRDGDQLSSYIEELRRDVLFLSSSPPIPGLIRAHNNSGYDPLGQSSTKLWHQRLTSLFSTLLSTNSHYMQARLLGANGMEIIRAERTENGIQLTPPEKLQNKSKQTYFKEIKQTQAGEIYLSAINLNREHGKISLPYTPILRAATPVFANGKLFCILIINLQFSKLLKELEDTYSTHEQTLYVTNHTGAYLSHPNSDKRFAFELGHHFRIQEDYPRLARLFAPGNTQQTSQLIPDDPNKDILVLVKIPIEKATPTNL